MVPENLLWMSEKYRINYHAYNSKPIEWDDYVKDLTTPLDESKMVQARFENTALYSPVGYTPQVMVMLVMRPLNASPILINYLSRLANLLFWIACSAYALSILRGKKLLAAILLLSPVSLYLAASTGIDAMTIALTVLMVAMLSRIYTSPSPGKNLMIQYCIILVALSLLKLPYFIAGTLLFIPALWKKNIIRTNFSLSIVTIALPILTGIGWYLFANTIYQPYRYNIPIDPGQQFLYVLTHPIDFIITLYHTYFTHQSDAIVSGILSELGILHLPIWMVMSWLILLVYTFLLLEPSQRKIHKILQYASLAVVIFLVLLISLMLYMSWTRYADYKIDGIMGRYFIPLLFIMLLSTSKFGWRKATSRDTLIIFLAAAVLLALSLIVIATLHYF